MRAFFLLQVGAPKKNSDLYFLF